jgi:hypothetical protein
MRVGSLWPRHECLPLFRVVLVRILRGVAFLPFYAVNRLWANQQQIDEYAVSFVET